MIIGEMYLIKDTHLVTQCVSLFSDNEKSKALFTSPKVNTSAAKLSLLGYPDSISALSDTETLHVIKKSNRRMFSIQINGAGNATMNLIRITFEGSSSNYLEMGFQKSMSFHSYYTYLAGSKIASKDTLWRKGVLKAGGTNFAVMTGRLHHKESISYKIFTDLIHTLNINHETT